MAAANTRMASKALLAEKLWLLRPTVVAKKVADTGGLR